MLIKGFICSFWCIAFDQTMSNKRTSSQVENKEMSARPAEKKQKVWKAPSLLLERNLIDGQGEIRASVRPHDDFCVKTDYDNATLVTSDDKKLFVSKDHIHHWLAIVFSSDRKELKINENSTTLIPLLKLAHGFPVASSEFGASSLECAYDADMLGGKAYQVLLDNVDQMSPEQCRCLYNMDEVAFVNAFYQKFDVSDLQEMMKECLDNHESEYSQFWLEVMSAILY